MWLAGSLSRFSASPEAQRRLRARPHGNDSQMRLQKVWRVITLAFVAFTCKQP